MLNLHFIQLIIDIVVEWYGLYGVFPTASQVRSKLQAPGL